MSTTDTATITVDADHDMTSIHTTELNHSIDELTRIIRRRTSRQYRLLSGVVTGIGTVIGASVLAGVVIYLLSIIVAGLDLDSIPAIQHLLEQTDITTN